MALRATPFRSARLAAACLLAVCAVRRPLSPAPEPPQDAGAVNLQSEFTIQAPGPGINCCGKPCCRSSDPL